MIELPKQERGFICTKCGSHECKPGTLNDKHPPCAKCDYLGFAQDTGYTADQLRTCIEQSAAEAREQMREECVKLIGKPVWLTWDVRAALITLIRKLS
jgi:hypothetical protein